MELKEGYKQTELGLIPDDWRVQHLGEKFTIKNGLNKAKEFFGYGTPIVNYMDVFGNSGIYKKDIKGKVFLTFQEKENYKVKLGDVLFTRTSETPEEIGMSSVMLEDITDAVFSGFVLRARPKDETFTNEYKKYCFRSFDIRKQIISSCSYTTRALTNGKSLSAVLVPIPSLPEQKAIAQVLSDTDNLIQAIDKKLAKKRAIKLGAMQQLLTPKEDWEVRKLGEVCDILDNLRVPLNSEQRLKMKGDIPYCGANGIVDYVNDYVIDDEIILMAEDGGYFDEYRTRPIAYIIKGKCWVNNHAHILKAKSNYFQDFIFYSVVHKNILDFINGGTRAKLNKGDLISIEINIPKSKEEQTHIATILSDMDAEIAQLEKKSNKYKLLKQGLMQELLTGRIRLI